MRSSLSIAIVAFGGLLLLACGGSGSDGPPKGGGGTGGAGLSCETLVPAPEGCDDLCPNGSDSECMLGTHCLNGVCAAQCTATQGCAVGANCNVRGRCVPDVGTGGTGGTGNTNGCQSVTITPTRSIPNVMFLVDQSGSMNANDFGMNNENRWTAAHNAITGIVDALDPIVRFGLLTYTSDDGFQNPPCPELPIQNDFGPAGVGAMTDLSNFPSAFPGGEDTPTGASIDAAVSIIQADPPPADGPTIIVVATDGEPDSCEYPDPGNNTPEQTFSRNLVVTAAGDAHDAGIDVFVLWVGDLDDNPSDPTRSHLQDVANAGVTGAGTVWVGDEPTSLSSAFLNIIGDSISCDIQMDKRFDDQAKACDEGDVRLNGIPLSCPSEWQVKPGADDVIELVGAACTTFKTEVSTFSATFPCGAIIVE
jgi:hypothetical protein